MPGRPVHTSESSPSGTPTRPFPYPEPLSLHFDNFSLDTTEARWEIACFFTWVKQNLKIKTFLGTSQNAVMTQIWTAMISYLLPAYITYQTSYRQSLPWLARVVRETLFSRLDIIDVLKSSLARVQRYRNPCPVPVLF